MNKIKLPLLVTGSFFMPFFKIPSIEGLVSIPFYFRLEAKKRFISSEASWAIKPLITWVFG